MSNHYMPQKMFQLGDRVIYLGDSKWLRKGSAGTIVLWHDELSVRWDEYTYTDADDSHDLCEIIILEDLYNSPLFQALL